MGSIFAPADIEKLVANFPPLSISENGRPPVIRTLSRNNLRGSSEVLAYFKALVERHDQRISRSNLTSVLGIEPGSEAVILDQLDSQLYYSTDDQIIIPHPLIEGIAQILKDRALRQAVDLHAFAREQDIGFRSLDRLIETYTGSDWPRVIIDVDATSFLCTHAYSEDVKTHISNAVSDTGDQICNLSQVVGDGVPGPVVVALATEVTASRGGTVRFSGEHVSYTPQGYDAAAAQQAEQARHQRIAEYLQQLVSYGYCIVREPASEFDVKTSGEPALDDLILAKFTQAQPSSNTPSSLDVADNPPKSSGSSTSIRLTKVIVRPETLQDELDHMKLAVGNRAGILWRTVPSTATPSNIVDNLQPSDYGTAHKEELAALLVKTEYAKMLEATALNCLSELESERHDQFVGLIEERLWCPLHCYAAGILEVKDPILKQHLEEFLTVHFKSDTLPNTVRTAKEQGFLHDRLRKRETDKLQKAIEEARTWDDIQKSIATFGKKLSIDPPTEDLVLTTKLRAVEQTVKAVQRMTRGSDVLQNLIWVLLATSGPGLFMSPGKDTSRMIKHYDSIADPEIAGMLAIWRDKLKSGMQDEEDLRQMKELAKSAAEEWRQGERTRPYAGT